jgi:hypothetical protein
LTGKDAWKNREYWQKSLEDLYDAYHHICAYTGIWISRPPNGQRSVDHFIPKKNAPTQAYEWSKFRLTSHRMNVWKDVHQDILDPFRISDDLFLIDFLSLEIKPNPSIPLELQSPVLITIERLKLNKQDCIRSREDWLNAYCENQCFPYLERRAPFIAYELKRQGLTQKIIDSWIRSQK